MPRSAVYGSGRRDRDQSASFAAFNKVARASLERQKRSGEVDVEDLVPFGQSQIDKGAYWPLDAGVGEHAVDFAQQSYCSIERGGDLVGVGYVAHLTVDAHSVNEKSSHGFLILLSIGAPDCDIGAGGDKALGHPQTDATITTGNQSDVSTEVMHCQPYSLCSIVRFLSPAGGRSGVCRWLVVGKHRGDETREALVKGRPAQHRV